MGKTVEEAFDAVMKHAAYSQFYWPNHVEEARYFFAAGAAYGAAEERECEDCNKLFNVLQSGVMTCNSTGAGREYYVRIDFKELTEAQNLHFVLAHLLQRIRQRGEGK